MSVRELGTMVARLLGELLKPHDFKRNGVVLLRESELYSERYVISGSRWNSGEEPWEFSVDVGVFFNDVPPRECAKGLWRNSHAVGGTDQIVEQSPPSFYVSHSNVEDVSRHVAAIVLEASGNLPALVGPAHKRAKSGFASPLPVPGTWAE